MGRVLPPSLTGLTPAGTQLALEQRAQQATDEDRNDILNNEIGNPYQTQDLMNNARAGQSIYMPGSFTPWLQALKDAGVSKLRGGPSPAGSNAMTGISGQTGDDLPSTLFDPDQTSAVDPAHRLNRALSGLGRRNPAMNTGQ